MDERNVLFFDFETTGLDVDTCGIVQAAAQLVRYSGESPPVVLAEQNFNTFVDPEMPIEPEASQYHGVIDSDVAEAGWKPVGEALKPLADMVKYAHYTSGHFTKGFDCLIAARLVSTLFAEKPVIDTLRVARRWNRMLPSHKLGALAYRFKLFDLTDKNLRAGLHDAVFDVMLCRAFFEYVCGVVNTSVDDLYTWHLTIEPAEHFSFGKYKGRRIADIAVEDPKLLEWCLRQDWFATDYPEDHAGVMQVLGIDIGGR